MLGDGAVRASLNKWIIVDKKDSVELGPFIILHLLISL